MKLRWVGFGTCHYKVKLRSVKQCGHHVTRGPGSEGAKDLFLSGSRRNRNVGSGAAADFGQHFRQAGAIGENLQASIPKID